jgi:hypothetical protein
MPAWAEEGNAKILIRIRGQTNDKEVVGATGF